MVRPRKQVNDPILKEWLNEFSNKNTKRQYCSAIRLFKNNLNIEDLVDNLKSEPDVASMRARISFNLQSYLLWMWT